MVPPTPEENPQAAADWEYSQTHVDTSSYAKIFSQSSALWRSLLVGFHNNRGVLPDIASIGWITSFTCMCMYV